MLIERVIEYLEAVKKDYPGGEVEEACDTAIEVLKRNCCLSDTE